MKPGDIKVNIADGTLEYDDGTLRVVPNEWGGPIADTFVPGEKYGLIPDTGVDMTQVIQEAFNTCPAGSTLILQPGVYIITDQVSLFRELNVYAYGAIFDLTTSDPTTPYVSTLAYGICESYNTALGQLTPTQRESVSAIQYNTAAFTWGWTGSGTRATRSFVMGLHVRRTAGGGGPALRKHVGICMLAPFECQLIDTKTTDFFSGLLLTATSVAGGCVYNRIIKHTSWNCRYSFDAYAVNNGWVNQNTFEDCRNLQSTGTGGVANGAIDKYLLEVQRVMMATTTASRPNNNKFVQCTWETADDKCGRKLRLEGSDHVMDNCRYEGLNTNASLIGASDSGFTGGLGNWVAGGDFAYGTNAAVFTYSTGSGTLTLPLTALTGGSTAAWGDHPYVLTYDVTANTLVGDVAGSEGGYAKPVFTLTGLVSSAHNLELDTHGGAYPVNLRMHCRSQTVPTDIVLTVSGVTSGSLTIDNVQLRRIDYDITIGNSEENSSNWQRNVFIGGGGPDLTVIYQQGKIEFKQSTAWLHNQGNIFFTGQGGNEISGSGGGVTDAIRTGVRFYSTSANNPTVSIANYQGATPGGGSSNCLDIFKGRSTVPWSGLAMFAFNDSSGRHRNWLGMVNGSPYDLRTEGGFNIANRFRVRQDSVTSPNDVVVQNPSNGVWFFRTSGASGGILIYNSSSAANQTLMLGAADRSLYWDWRATNTAYLAGGHWGGLAMLVGGTGTNPGNMANGISLHTTVYGGHADAYPIRLERGVLINNSKTDADSRVSGAAETNLTYWDASTDRVGIGTNAPDSQLHLTAKIHIGTEAEIDGALNHDGTTVGFYGATPAAQSTGWTITNKTEDKVLDCNATSIDEVADVLGTLIDQLKTLGILGG